MAYRKNRAALLLPIAFAAIGGCASRSELAELRADVDALVQQSEARGKSASETLRTATLASEEIATVRLIAEQAASDADASRRLIEAMDARMSGSLGQGTLK